MSIDTQVQGNAGCIAMAGRFDLQVHRQFREAYTQLLDNVAVHQIELELSRVTYLDSSALGMLMLLNERAHAAKKSVTLLNASGVVLQVLEVANFGKIFTIRNAN
ncbi:MAG: STAS domain-containing protein [Pseudomonadota bacterium]